MNGYYFPTLDDPFNTLGMRNINNTVKRQYNCGGYALGTFSWYWPGRTEEERDKIMEYAEAEDWDNALELAAGAIIRELPGWMVVPFNLVMERKYSPKEYEVVAMRFCDSDFHFWKLGRNWNWYDKMGSTKCIHRHAFEDVRRIWCYRYNSPIVCFIRAR